MRTLPAVVGVLLASCIGEGPLPLGHTAAPEKDRLFEIVRPWIGTPYRVGGRTKSGTDCSGFAQAVMEAAYEVKLPRTSSDQARTGVAVSRDELRPGDLVFFDLRTRKKGIDHVGVYLGGGRFAHASRPRGVVIDRLDERYYRTGYRRARRVLSMSAR